MSQIIIGYTTEGSTDFRFLEGIIQRTFEDIAFECNQQIEILPIISIAKSPGAFVQKHLQTSRNAYSYGCMVFCIHVDADSTSDENVLTTRFIPLKQQILSEEDDRLCDNIVPIIPVHMTEAWMLADKALLKSEIGTNMSDNELGLSRGAESIADPKEVIKEAIRIANSKLPKKRRHELDISELYLPLGQKISLNSLKELPSFVKFTNEIRQAYRKLNYMQ